MTIVSSSSSASASLFFVSTAQILLPGLGIVDLDFGVSFWLISSSPFLPVVSLDLGLLQSQRLAMAGQELVFSVSDDKECQCTANLVSLQVRFAVSSHVTNQTLPTSKLNPYYY